MTKIKDKKVFVQKIFMINPHPTAFTYSEKIDLFMGKRFRDVLMDGIITFFVAGKLGGSRLSQPASTFTVIMSHQYKKRYKNKKKRF